MSSKVYWGSPRQARLEANESLPAKLELILTELHLRDRVKDELVAIRKRLLENPWYLKLMMVSIPLPFLAHTAGWVLAEVGRQPWIVYGLMKTADAVSPIGPLSASWTARPAARARWGSSPT